MRSLLTSLSLLLTVVHLTPGELLQNRGFESTNDWVCGGCHCATTNTRHSGQHALQVTDRRHNYDGPAQVINVRAGASYSASAWFKMLNDHNGQNVAIMLDVHYTDNTHDYLQAAVFNNAKTSNGWFQVQGTFTVPTKSFQNVRLYVQSRPSEAVNFIIDEASVTELDSSHVSRASLDRVIDQERKSDINLVINTASNINRENVRIRVLQKRKSFPFGTAVRASAYNSNAGGGKYRDFIHQHFNWAVTENALKWPQLERHRGQSNYQPALDVIHGLRNHGIKVRGHNLVWSVERFVQDWVKQLQGNELRNVVSTHIQETLRRTHNLLEHWDVNNENLHGQWYQDRLNDPDYNLELFRIAHQADPNVKLFLNDYSVVAGGAETNNYLAQARQFKAANVGLYGIGVQCHFGQEPDPTVIKSRLDILAAAGVPIWVTELDVLAHDENTRADYYETALRSLYGHPAVEGILLWGFWDQAHWRGEDAALVRGDNVQLTAAGRRFLDLLENQWMTDETRTLSQSGNHFTVRGFHGDYEVHVIYNGHELNNLKQTFTLGNGAKTVNINVHT